MHLAPLICVHDVPAVSAWYRKLLGCTSGHGISGSLQLAASSWLFVLVMFPAAIGTAYLLYGREGAKHV